MLKSCLTHLPIYPENYFLAAYVALSRLRKRFARLDEATAEKVWNRLDIESYPACVDPIGEKIQARGLLPEREKKILQLAQFPTVYGVVQSKIEVTGAKAFLKNYLRIAVEDPEYLAHRISILSSFYQLWTEVEPDQTLKHLWADRLTEFLEKSFTKAPTNYSLLKVSGETELSKSEIIKEILLKPGYNGHHVIALSAATDLQSELLKREYETLLAKLSHLPQVEYEDVDDNVVISALNNQNHEGLEKTVVNFLLQGPEEPRTIVLADALANLWDQAEPSVQTLIIANFQRFLLRH